MLEREVQNSVPICNLEQYCFNRHTVGISNSVSKMPSSIYLLNDFIFLLPEFAMVALVGSLGALDFLSSPLPRIGALWLLRMDLPGFSFL